MTENIRAKILAEALREIDQHGAEFHMDDLARQLRISKRTLYEYFSSKQEIVEQAIISFFDPIYEYHQKLLDDKTMTCEEKIIAFFEIPNKIGKSCPCGIYANFWRRCPMSTNAWNPVTKRIGVS